MFAASKTASVSTGGYQISRSLRFNSADSAYLNRTPASAGNKQTWTLSVWVKRGSLGAFNPIYSAGGTSPRAYLIFNSSDKMDFRSVDSGNTEVIRVTTTQVFRDPSAWYHIVVAQDTTQATSSNRLKMYVNGVQITAFDTATYPTQNISNLAINDALEQNYGRYVNSPSDGYLSAYLTETNFIDGSQLTPSSFGETNAQTGVWQPKAYSGSYGTNGFYLNFSDNSNTTAATLGKDYSGNGNNWTPNNFSVSAGTGNDSLVDTPTAYGTDTGVGGTVRGNYCTFNPVGLGGGTLTNGNLDLSTTVTIPAVGTMAMTTGKWYWEITNNSVSAPRIGVYNIGAANPADLGATANGWCLLNSPSRTYTGGSAVSYGTYSPTTGTVVMVAYDADAGKLWFGQDGTWFASGNPASGTSPSLSSVTGSAIVPAIANGNSGTDTFSANFGQRPFAYTAPSGYKALCTQNLPTPTIGATTATQAGKYFNPVLYTGNGAAQTISGFGFQPDLVWFKCRSVGGYNNFLFDAVRGVGKTLISNDTSAESDYSSYISPFTSDGYQIATTATSFNQNGQTFVSWGWKANGSGSSNTSGSITSTVSANTTSGFSVVTYTTTGSASTVGHGLGNAPAMIITKQRNGTTAWYTYHASIGATDYVLLNSTAAKASSSVIWNNTAPTSTVFSLGSGFGSGETYVAYCFAEVAGYSKFGSYVGNASADGPFVYCGFKPAYVMIKEITNSIYPWCVFDKTRDPSNVVTKLLLPNASDAEYTVSALDFTSNGFKIRDTNGSRNNNGSTYIFMAFAETPLKFSLAR